MGREAGSATTPRDWKSSSKGSGGPGGDGGGVLLAVIYDWLEETGHDVHLAHPKELKAPATDV